MGQGQGGREAGGRRNKKGEGEGGTYFVSLEEMLLWIFLWLSRTFRRSVLQQKEQKNTFYSDKIQLTTAGKKEVCQT